MEHEPNKSWLYSSLEAGEFRLLLVCPSDDPSARIECRFVQEQLPGTEPYDAIS